MNKSLAAMAKIKDLIRSGVYANGAKLPAEREIAQELGVSQGTITKAIAALEAEGFVRKAHGSGNYVELKERSKSICFVMESMGSKMNPIWHSIFEHYYYAGQGEAKIELRVLSKNELASISPESFSGFDLLVAAFSPASASPSWAKLGDMAGKTFFLDECEMESKDFALVCTDNFAAGEMVASHFIEEGRKRLCYLQFGFEGEYYPAKRRLDGFISQAGKQAYPGSSVSCISCFPGSESFRNDMKEALGFFDAILCFSDELAVRATAAARSLGVAVPGSVAIAGIDGLPIGAAMSPSLTSVRQPCEAVARKAWELSSAALSGQPLEGSFKIKPELVVRESSGGPSTWDVFPGVASALPIGASRSLLRKANA